MYGERKISHLGSIQIHSHNKPWFDITYEPCFMVELQRNPFLSICTSAESKLRKIKLWKKHCTLTLFKSPIWKPGNSLTFISGSLSGDSPEIPWSSCLKSRLWIRERPLEWFFTLMPVSCGAFLPTDPIIRSDSIFVYNRTIQHIKGSKCHCKWF